MIPFDSDVGQAIFNINIIACQLVKKINAFETPFTSRNFSLNIFVGISKVKDFNTIIFVI